MAPVLLFTGRGTSAGDVGAVQEVLNSNHLEYETADSADLNAMGPADFGRHRLLIVPGGNFETMGRQLSAATPAQIRSAVQHGLNYLGICAGAFFAGDSPYNGLNLTSGVRFPFYAAENRGIRKAAVSITGVDMPPLDVYWEDGPQLTGWGEIVAKYPDGTAAVTEGSFGNGWVVLSGVHPEAPEIWRRGLTFHSAVSEDHAYAGRLIRAALDRTALPHY